MVPGARRAPRIAVDGPAEDELLTRRRFLAVAGGAALAAGACALYAWQVEPHRVELVRRRMPLPNLPDGLRGATLLQLSDIHVGPRVDSGYLVETFRSAAELEPDFVVYTGDFISWRTGSEPRELARVLRAAPRGRRATLAVLGNHDYGDAWRDMAVAREVTSIVTDAGVRVLRNERMMVDGLQVAGVGDLWSPEFAAAPLLDGAPRGAGATLATLDRQQATLVLCHNPDALDLPLWDGIRGWVLAGHTHGGQCKPPFLPPPILPVRNKRYTAGAFDVGPGRMLYINRGLGHLIQVRFNVRPELTLFTLERGDPV